MGLGSDFAKAFSLLENDLRELIDVLPTSDPPDNLKGLLDTLADLGDRNAWGHEGWSKARVMVLTAISLSVEDMISATSLKIVEGIEGRRDQILIGLRSRNIHVLRGGTLERYLPHFNGNVYKPTSNAKQTALEAELAEILKLQSSSGSNIEDMLADRYGDLYTTVCRLPSKTEADIDGVLRRHLSDYTHELQKVARDNPEWHLEQLQRRLSTLPTSKGGFVSLQVFERNGADQFVAKIAIIAMQREGPRSLKVTEQTTIANMGELEPSQTSLEIGC